MEIPKHLQDLVDRLGRALVQALAEDPVSRELAREIQLQGYDIALMLEATVALQRREGWEAGPATGVEAPGPPGGAAGDDEDRAFSEEDRALLRTFKISLE